MIGFDTGFFFRLFGKDKQIERFWTSLEGKEKCVSVITLYELKKAILKGIGSTKLADLAHAFKDFFTLVSVTPEIADKAAYLSHGTGMHMSDALIFTSLQEAGCKEIYTEDIKHFGLYKGKEIKICSLPKRSRNFGSN